MGTFREFLASQYPDAQITELSTSNNALYRVVTASGAIVAKHVTDTDIPLSYLAAANARLADHMPVQRILRVYEQEQGDPFDAVLAEYVEGTDLATVLSQDAAALSAAELAGLLGGFVTACRDLPAMHDGFGMFKRGAPVMATHREYVEYYAKRYWQRARRFYDGTPVGDAVEKWLAGGLAEGLVRHPAPCGVVAVDANLKNFVVTPDRRLVVLNVPIAGVSTPAHAVAAVSVHLRNHEVHRTFLDLAAEHICPDDAAMVPHFEMWTLIGILSFYAVREPEGRGSWRDFGSPVLLDEDFTRLADSLLRGSAPR